MKLFQSRMDRIERIKNLPKRSIPKDFNYNAFSYLILVLFIAAGIAAQTQVDPGVDMTAVAAVAAFLLIGGGVVAALPMWGVVLQLLILIPIALAITVKAVPPVAFGIGIMGLVISASFQLVFHWDKVVVLRFGKFRKVHGPGLFMLMPLVDRIAAFVDTRIRATDFSAEKTLTKDMVPVHVDALAFWMIWDAKRAILEVQDFLEAVTLSAQTALRDSIGKHDFRELLSEREKLADMTQKALDAKTNPWGITILSIEFTDIIIPKELEDALSKRAQAERELLSRSILGDAEIEVAKKFEEAAKVYQGNETALHLRAMNMVYEGIRQKGSLMVLPSSILGTMNIGTVMGAAAVGKDAFDEPVRSMLDKELKTNADQDTDPDAGTDVGDNATDEKPKE
jgi:regulator of protease activity HflC (stomatin/prohibitin superfamily)